MTILAHPGRVVGLLAAVITLAIYMLTWGMLSIPQKMVLSGPLRSAGFAIGVIFQVPWTTTDGTPFFGA
jgi:hypothetical protein